MNLIKDFFGNYVLMSAVAGWFTAQLIKCIISLCRRDRLNYLKLLLFSNGGMPSSHSASVVGLCVACGILYGLNSAAFAISAVFSMVVMIDASGVRYETGEQAKILNKITKELFSGDHDMVNTGLKELVGHTPFQVLMGAITGAVIAVSMAFAMKVL